MQGVKFLAAVLAIILPTKVLPVKQIRSSGYLFNSTATSTPPSIHLKNSESMYLSKSFAITLLTWGEISEGFIITEFPAQIALATGFSAKETG